MSLAYKAEWAYVLAATIRVTGDIDVAEECVQDSFARALEAWSTSGIPTKPGAWLTTVARRQAIDLLRRQSRQEHAFMDIGGTMSTDLSVDAELTAINDDRLRLIFTCCHPALSIESQVELTLKLICGLTTAEIAHAFLVSETTMAARLTRAKKKIKSANIPYRVPIESEFPLRIDAVLSTLQLVFTTGHTAPTGSELVREDLIESSIQLTRMLNVLLPDHPDVQGLLALILLTNARQRTRVDVEGRLLLLSEQDRSLWNRESIVEGLGLVRLALRSKPVGRFVLMASIAAVHAESPTWEETDWNEIVGLYDVLLAQWPSPVVALNRAVSIGLSVGPQAGLDALDLLSGDPYLADYSYLASARADFLRRLNRFEEARDAYVGALALSENDVERNFLMGRLSSLDA